MSKPLILGNLVGAAVKKSFKVLPNPTVPIEEVTVTKPIAIFPTAIRERPEPSVKARKIRPVSFSLVDPLEAKMTDHADQFSCFSTYIKRLIQRDMEGGHVIQGPSRFQP